MAYTQVAAGSNHTLLLRGSVSGRPIAVDDVVSTNEDTPVEIAPATLLANDSDPDGDPLHIVSVFGATHGSAAMVPTAPSPTRPTPVTSEPTPSATSSATAVWPMPPPSR